jgi:hypothetical protein
VNFLKAVKASQEQGASLKFKLHAHLASADTARSPLAMHASDATKADYCARFQAIRVAAQIKLQPEPIGASLAYTFAQGRLMQDWLVNTVADMGLAIGDWKCMCCSKKYVFCKRPVSCQACGAKDFKPIEVRFQSQVSGLSGGFDMLYNAGLPKLRLVEIKIMAPDAFKTLVAPLGEHKLRTSLYMRIAAESINPLSEHIDYDRALVIYMSRGFGIADPSLMKAGLKDYFSPFKEFLVERDDKMTDGLSQSSASFYHWAFKNGPMPDRICQKQDQPRACKCIARAYCFGEAFPPGVALAEPLFAEEVT